MNIVPFAADVEPLKLTDWITAVGTVVALGMSAFALWWQRRLLDRQLKHELYEKRLTVYHKYREILTTDPPVDDPDLSRSTQFLPILLKEVELRFEARCLFGLEVQSKLHYIHDKCWETRSNLAALEQRKLTESLTQPELSSAFVVATQPFRDAALVWIDCGKIIEGQLNLYDDSLGKRAWWWLKAKLKYQTT